MNINIGSENSTFFSYEFKEILNDIHHENKKVVLFLDIDGTLAEFKNDPSECYIPEDTLNLIRNIQKHIVVAAITGRDLFSAKKLFKQINLPIAALHGLVIYLNDEKKFIKHSDGELFQRINTFLNQQVKAYPELNIENKQHAIALHYRKCPQLKQTAWDIMRHLQEHFNQLKLITGKYVYELVWKDIDKGQAIAEISALLKLENHLLIFIGDDRTDEDGFQYINSVNGISIKVGMGATKATYTLKDIAQVTVFLKNLSHSLSHSLNDHGIKEFGEEHV
ncbi:MULTISPECIES: trehalose-phosphatase [unclassified Acinetobacter]|uniref:trehalose-phosphatase n=1 Tax=unclassified Acinetobacter TaxID=196816 RepID=UPI0019095787|nr:MULTISPECIES: trehalose-phosphatase [unclassified Acinetobacter]MBK0064113.1 trehalose-phosphatase [Acinetobacter sp. S55]MBK0067378.1 trehalose-phosphatase [Acinetobacter sp. S54]